MKRKHPKTGNILQCYLMMLPSLTGLALFVVFPIIWVFRYCLFRYIGYGNITYVGLDNFVRIFTKDAAFWNSVINTFIFAFGKLLVELPLALVIANILSNRFRGATVYRTAFYLPAVLSVAIVGLQFSYLFGAYAGVINEWLLGVGFQRILGMKLPISWFSLKPLSMSILMLASIWQNFGINMIFFMTGLQSIPIELYKAADIDGANGRQRFFLITIPMLGPVIQMIIMQAILGSLKVSALVLTLTNGQPAGSTEVMMTYIYKMFFENATAANYGYASALVIVATVILTIVALVYMRMTRKSSTIY